MEELVNDAGLGLSSIEEREKIWRQSVMRVGSNLRRFNVKVPSMPEIGINGDEDIEIKEDDLVAAIF